MFDLKKEWSISFAGCGFMGIYYVGASSCILERFPRLIQSAYKLYGASAGALTAAVLCAGISLEKCCGDLMFMAREARRHKLGPLHPTYKLMQIVQDSILKSLPDDAHVRVSGKLCVSLTRVSDGKNVLVSEFENREDLIQALICSCFVPLYCGVIPPTYRGVHYVDGAVSDNLPRCGQKNTVTVSAYAGDSDLCPPASALNLRAVRFNNVSIQVNAANLYRVTNTFFPPEPEVMAEICNNGYKDALRFLLRNNLISSGSPHRSLEAACCDRERTSPEAEEHGWLNPQLIQNLPVGLQRALCAACRESPTSRGLPAEEPTASPRSLAQRLTDWIPGVPRDMTWVKDLAGELYRKAMVDEDDQEVATRVRRCASLLSELHLCGSPEPPPS
ncbi:patatin-like phospholipase domain-containing protein 2 [Synchiropus splendidus]|uniref:patatin-like phospholipase domain-containing protein 2 n=1 Tax=Synchiropus splendidus TaxID=270530 RepID=UPI00237EA6B0|nr:patatin-like phospholipase domain-containing protein 2 [Synchiropus splendidus]